MSDLVISVESLSKLYRIGVQQHSLLTDYLTHRLRRVLGSDTAKTTVGNQQAEFWALKDVSFEARHGEVIGVIGRNGAGKSTLLKVLSRITLPTKGRARIFGRVGSLLEVGTGFHPELTGRENIFLSGAILGMRRVDISRKFDEIVEFAEIGQFLDTPVKRYSSGMYVKLAFAVAAHLETDILIVDEVLSVGDAAFQKKCLGKMDDVRKGGRTIILVSHDLPTIANLCRRVIWMKKGAIAEDGDPHRLIEGYLKETFSLANTSLLDRTDRSGEGAMIVSAIEFYDGDGKRIQHAMSGKELRVRVRYHGRSNRVFSNYRVLASFNHEGRACFVMATDLVDQRPLSLSGDGYIEFTIPDLPLGAGRYYINAAIEHAGNTACQDWVESAGEIEVVEGDYYGTGKLYPHDGWRGQGMFVRHSWRPSTHKA